MKSYLSKYIKDAIIEAQAGMNMDKEHTIQFVIKNVPGVSYNRAKTEVNNYINTKYKVSF